MRYAARPGSIAYGHGHGHAYVLKRAEAVNIFRRYKDELTAIALLALPFFSLRANLSDPSRASFLDRWILAISAPVQWVAVRMATGVSGFIEEYVYLVEVGRENERPNYESARLSACATSRNSSERTIISGPCWCSGTNSTARRSARASSPRTCRRCSE